MTRSVSENPVVGPRASVSVTGKYGEAGDIGAYRRYSRTPSRRRATRSKPDRILRQAPRTAFLTLLLPALSVVVTGCLKYGDDVETTSPTEAQVARCRAEMCLNPALNVTPLGFKLEGSGIDDAIWFKFSTDASNVDQIFDMNAVDTAKFKDGFNFAHKMDALTWWDVNSKALLGAQVELPNARFMNVGIVRTDAGYLVYIMWHEV